MKAERERLKAIDEIAAGIPGDVLTRAKYDEPISAADLALAQMKANNKAGQQTLNNRLSIRFLLSGSGNQRKRSGNQA